MAEPLLRRTFSRLRGRDRPRGKKADGKDREHHPSSPDSPVEPEATPAEPVPVTPRKHHRGRFSCGGREERPPKSSPDPSELAPAAGVDPPQGEDDLEPAEEAEAVNGSGELGGAGRSPGTGRNPGPGAYLQSLERSSRHWVLSGGPGWEEPGGGTQTAPGAAGSEGEIWYNPIPEDEDPQVPGSSRKTGGGGNGDGAGESPPKMGKDEPPRSGLGTPEGSGPRGGTAPAALPTAGRGEEAGTGRSQACGKMPIPCVTSGLAPSPPSPPASPKKGRSLSKVKSPGTVRRLSMKMKKLPELRRKLSLRSPRPRGQEGGTSSSETPQESSNVISRYHLDTSVASGPGLPRAKGASKGGYLSDGDSPELLAKNGARDRGEEEEENGLDVELFRPYNYEEAPTPPVPGGGQHISGLVTVHLHGLGDLKPPRAENREVFCLLQVDAANRARTALLPLKKTFLGLNHTFNLELESARHLKVLVFSWDPTSCRNRLCCHGTVVLPHIFRGCRAQRLAVRLTPRGVLYSKLTLVERWEDPSQREPRVFGVELGKLVEREKAPTKVPLIIQKCLAEIEKRGLKVVGLYRLCGSAAVKKDLRDAFERDSAAVTLSEQLYPDINVITGILKDYLRELPTPLITPTLYHVVLEAMAKRPPRTPPAERDAVSLLDCLPDVEKATLRRLLDHLSLVASFHPFNRMNAQNIAVCFGPVLLTQSRDARPPPHTGLTGLTGGGATSGATTRGYSRGQEVASAVDFKKHIEVLHYLLQAWPAPRSALAPQFGEGAHPSCPQQPRAPPLRLDLLESSVVARPRPRGPESPPSNRYAGDWSVCDHQFLLLPGPTDHAQGATGEAGGPPRRPPGQRTLLVADFGLGEEGEAAFGPPLNLKDFDALILDLERELGKQINVCL